MPLRANSKRVSYPKWMRLSVLGIAAILIGLNLVFPVPLKAARTVSPVVTDHEGKWIAGFTVEDGVWRIPANLDEIDPRFIERLITIEDSRFANHSGVDLLAIARAGRSWVRAGKPVSGGSTLTMQLVRQLEPRPRTLKSKIIESLRAVQYELWLSKQDILELYLTHVPYGGNIEGVHAASLSYFGKPPFQLTDAEIALLIALPQAPEARRPDIHQAAARKGRDKILEKLGTNGSLTQRQVREAKESPVQQGRSSIPERAWITAYGLSRKGSQISTLDYDIQGRIEALTTRFVSPLDGPVNTAITVVHNPTMSVRAHIASADRRRPGGWIDMTNRARSPGSTLKPFIYGLAMDDGVLSGSSFIKDAPTRFGTYQPENFNRRYYGDVRIYEALRHSLNVPAVAVLDHVGGARLEQTLKTAGVDVKRIGDRSESAGLALALGGAGMSVNDLAVIYAALANDGMARPLKWTHDDEEREFRLLTENTAKKITQILRQSPTPKGRVPAWLTENSPPIAYKTGTSYGFRDAWAAGYTQDWTVIVWVGRPDGAPRNGQTGRLAAAPLLYDIFAQLPFDGRSQSFTRDLEAPSGLSRVSAVSDQGPQILFPPDGSELLAAKLGREGRGFALAARVKSGKPKFYVDGRAIPRDGRQAIWYPDHPGFYTVRAVDEDGTISESKVEILSLQQIRDARL
jgi:penicillin-binding protein 1C